MRRRPTNQRVPRVDSRNVGNWPISAASVHYKVGKHVDLAHGDGSTVRPSHRLTAINPRRCTP
jgi:hypothetical protein